MLRRVCASMLGAGMCALTLAFVACGGSGGDADDVDAAGSGGSAGSGPAAGSGGAGGAGSGGVGGAGGAGGAAGSGVAGESGAAGGGGAAGSGGADTGTSQGYTELDNTAYAGIDLSELPLGQAPEGCVGGFDPAKGALALTLKPPVSFVLVGAFEGSVVANGVPCTAPDGSQARVSALRSISARGGAGPDTFVLDLGTGDFGPTLWSPGEGVSVELGGGGNKFYLRGSAGADSVRLGRVGAAVSFDLNGDAATDVQVEGAATIGASLGPGDDSFEARGFGAAVAYPLAVSVHGDDGDDTLAGGNGNDALFGDAGRDTFTAGPAPDGADEYDGGEGEDRLDYGARSAALNVTTDGQANDGQANEHDNVRASVEGVFGGSGDDVFVGGDENNFFDGRGGSDRLEGRGGSDSLYGSEGDDKLYGGEQDDLLDGGTGVNELDGGASEGDICFATGLDTAVGCEL